MAPRIEQTITATAGGSACATWVHATWATSDAEARADQRDADEVREDHQQRAGEAADERAHDHADRVAAPIIELARHRAEDEAVDPEHDAEQPVAGETGERSAEQQQQRGRQLVRRAAASRVYTSRRPSSALCIVTSSA